MFYKKRFVHLLVLFFLVFNKPSFALPFKDLFPARGQLILLNGGETFTNCDGVMIHDPEISDEAFFLTAAHCISDEIIGVYYNIGDIFIPTKKAFKHPRYNDDPKDLISIGSDIMVIKVDQEIFKRSGIKTAKIFKGGIKDKTQGKHYDLIEKKLIDASEILGNEIDFSISSLSKYLKYYKSPVKYEEINNFYSMYLIANGDFLAQLCSPPFREHFEEICSSWNQESIELIGDWKPLKFAGFSENKQRGILVCEDIKCAGFGESGAPIFISENHENPDYQVFGLVSGGPGIFGQYFHFVSVKEHIDFIKNSVASN